MMVAARGALSRDGAELFASFAPAPPH